MNMQTRTAALATARPAAAIMASLSAAALGIAVLGLAATAPARAAPTSSAPPLVDAAWLRAHLHDRGQVILEVYDTATQRPAYEAGHIPGAVFTGFLNDGWRVPRDGIPGMLPPPEQIAGVIGHFGIGNATRVIIVPAGRARGDFNAAARVFWTLRMEGADNASILNGGDRAWFADPADPVARGNVPLRPAVFVPHPTTEYLATMPMVRATLDSHAAQLVDARPPAQFEGRVKAPVDARAGTLPGARNLPFSAVLTADGEGVRPMPELAQALHRAGVERGAPSITFCNTGHFASTDWFVLREVLANPRVRLYDGSMSEWSRNPALPMVPGHSAF